MASSVCKSGFFLQLEGPTWDLEFSIPLSKSLQKGTVKHHIDFGVDFNASQIG